MLTDTILFTADAITVKLEYDIQHLLQLSHLDVLGGGVAVLQLYHLHLFAEFIWAAHQLLYLLINLSLFFTKRCHLVIECMHDLPLN